MGEFLWQMVTKRDFVNRCQREMYLLKKVLLRVPQDELRKVANKVVNDWAGEQIKGKSKRCNRALTVVESKVA